MQVWGDAACTIPPAGVTDTLYVQLNRDYGYNCESLWGGYANPADMMFIFTPTTDYPDETYSIRGYRNFLSKEQKSPFLKGQVIRIVNELEAVDVSSFKTEFY